MMHRQRAKCWIQRLQVQKRAAVWLCLTFHLLYLHRHMLGCLIFVPHMPLKSKSELVCMSFPILSLCNIPQAVA